MITIQKSSPKALPRSSLFAIMMMLVALQLLTSHPSCNESYLPESTSIKNGDDDNNNNNNSNNSNTAFLEEPQIANLNYSWIGDHWIPPQGVPRYSSQQINDIFSDLNILWTGDSLSRQGIQTMVNMMNAADYSDITVDALKQDLNNQSKWQKGRKCVDRDFSETSVLGHNHNPYTFACRNIPGVDNTGTSNTSNLSTLELLPNAIPSKGKFDYSMSACPDVLTQVANDELNGTLTSLIDGYDWVIISLGIGEVEQNWDCPVHNTSESSRIRMGTVLELTEQLASPRLSIIWQTMGRAKEMEGSQLENLNTINTQIRQFFASKTPKHMHLMDWAQQIDPRTDDGANRIGGHPARLLAAQMVTHTVVTL